jgi:hypothetical protein
MRELGVSEERIDWIMRCRNKREHTQDKLPSVVLEAKQVTRQEFEDCFSEIFEHVLGMHWEIRDVLVWHQKEHIRVLIEEVLSDKEERLNKLRDDAAKALRLLVDKNIVTQAELNRAVA